MLSGPPVLSVPAPPGAAQDGVEQYLLRTIGMLDSELASQCRELEAAVRAAQPPYGAPAPQETSEGAAGSYVEGQRQVLDDIIKQVSPPVVNLSVNPMDLSILKEWERWYQQVAKKVLDHVQGESENFLRCSDPSLDFAPLESSSSSSSSMSAAGGASAVHRPSTSSLIADAFLAPLASCATLAVSSLLSQNRSNMFPSSFSLPKYEQARWDAFSSVVALSLDVPSRLVHQAFYTAEASQAQQAGGAGTFASAPPMPTHHANHFNTTLVRALQPKWLALLLPLTEDLVSPISTFVTNEVRDAVYNFECPPPPLFSGAPASNSKHGRRSSASGPVSAAPSASPQQTGRRVSAASLAPGFSTPSSSVPGVPASLLSTSSSSDSTSSSRNVSAIRAAVSDRSRILAAGEHVADIVRVFTPLLQLCPRAAPPPTAPSVAPSANASVSPEKEDKPKSKKEYKFVPPSLYYVFVSTMSMEIGRFTEWLLFMSRESHCDRELVTTCVLATQSVARGWVSAVAARSDALTMAGGGWDPLEALEDRVALKIREQLLDCEAAHRELVKGTSLTQVELAVVPGIEGIAWEHHVEFMSNERCTYGMTCYATFLAGLANDLRLADAASAQAVEDRCFALQTFSNVLEKSLEAIASRYSNIKPSRVLTAQWKVDVMCVLRVSGWFTGILSAGLKFGGGGGGTTLQMPSQPMRSEDVDALSSCAEALANAQLCRGTLMLHLALLCGRAGEVCAAAAGLIGGGVGHGNSDAAGIMVDEALEACGTLKDWLRMEDCLTQRRVSVGLPTPQKALFDVLAVNGILSGQSKEKFFAEAAAAELPWREVLSRAKVCAPARFLNSSAVKTVLMKRHELNDWSFPELSAEQQLHKQDLLEMLKSLIE